MVWVLVQCRVTRSLPAVSPAGLRDLGQPGMLSCTRGSLPGSAGAAGPQRPLLHIPGDGIHPLPLSSGDGGLFLLPVIDLQACHKACSPS